PWREAVRIIQASEIWQVYGAFVESKKPKFGPGVADRMKIASTIPKSQPDAARETHAAVRAKLRAVITPGTVVAVPSAPCIAPLITTSAAEMESFRVR